jgi:mono/diheme cytochrome c family protein
MNIASTQSIGRRLGLRCIVLASALLMIFGWSLVGASIHGPPTHFDQENLEREVLDGKQHQLGDTFIISLGGRVYDNFWVMFDENSPAKRNPDYPSNNITSNADTWRCVTCHGWDYTGTQIMKDQERQRTRLSGLRHLEGAGPLELFERFNTAHPAYAGDLLTEQALELLLLFVSVGQYERETFLKEMSASGEQLEGGQNIFEGICMSCHGPLGTDGLDDKPGLRPSLGWLARHEPERTLHKIINGVPGTEMLALRFVEDDSIWILMAYLRTLDPEY